MGRVEFSGNITEKIATIFGDNAHQKDAFVCILSALSRETDIHIGGGTVREALGVQRRDLVPILKYFCEVGVHSIVSKDTLGLAASNVRIRELAMRFTDIDLDFDCADFSKVCEGLDEFGIPHTVHPASNGVPIVDITNERGCISFVSQEKARRNSVWAAIGKLHGRVEVLDANVTFVGEHEDGPDSPLGERALHIDGLVQTVAEHFPQACIAVAREELYQKTLRSPDGTRWKTCIESRDEAIAYALVLNALPRSAIVSVQRDWLLCGSCF